MNSMNIFHDVTIIAPVLNILNTIANIYWSMKLKQVQGNAEIIKALREQNEESRELLKDMHEKKNRYKSQYNQLLIRFKALEGENDVYRKLNGHVTTYK